MNSPRPGLYKALGYAYSSTEKWQTLPSRNRIKDNKIVENTLRIMRINDQGLKVDSKEELRKCLYINKPMQITLSNGRVVLAEELSKEGKKLLFTEIDNMKTVLNRRNLTNLTGLSKSILLGQRYGSTIRHYMKARNLKKLARISTPESRLPAKVRYYHDQRAFDAIVGYLSNSNENALMKKYVREEIIKPIFRDLFT